MGNIASDYLPSGIAPRSHTSGIAPDLNRSGKALRVFILLGLALTNLWKNKVARELPADRAIIVLFLLLLTRQGQSILADLDLKLLRLKVADIDLDLKLLFSVLDLLF